uniref:Protein Wnt n=1 Tax=Paracentrotus lividus TaxID=7656 RepID=A0A023VZ61_PARLI|nr:Wnt16 [Paracentrotus lividus]
MECISRQNTCKRRNLTYRCGVVCILWISIFLTVPTRTDATWMWLGAASLGAVSVGRDGSHGGRPGQHDVTEAPPIHNILIDPKALCQRFPGLTVEQRRVCANTPDIINMISEGAKVGIIECQRQFSTERWNCSVIGDVNNPFGEVMSTGNRETAFIYAITSAGVVYSVTRSCSVGNLTECGCANPRGQPSSDVVNDDEEWKWGGCTDDVDYGIKLARKFVDSADKFSSSSPSPSPPPSSAMSHPSMTKPGVKEMNLHNNEVGRQLIKSGMKTLYRCHGVSASCSLKTCWKAMPNFKEIGDLVKLRYREGVEVVVRTKKHVRLRRKDRRMRREAIASDELVYMQRSPNYCRTNPDLGIVGTTGRECNRTSTGSDSCDLLCCGRGYNTQVIRRIDRCDCKFIWCCKVKCRVCETVSDIYTCK